MGQREHGAPAGDVPRAAGKCSFWNTDTTVQYMKPREEAPEETASLESLRRLRLLALLHDVVRDLGQAGAAKELGIDRKTLWRSMAVGKLTPRLSDALERLLLSRNVSAGDLLRDRVEGLDRRIAALKEAVAAIEAEERGSRDGVAEQARAVEGRLAALESRRAGQGAASPAPVDGERQAAGRTHDRRHPQLVTVDPEPGEDRVYGEATPLIVEWRRVRTDRLEARDRLSRARTEERMRELEITMIREFRLTLPPETRPWDDRARTDAVHLRTQALERVRGERIRAQWQRRVRRIVTLGLWWR